MLPFKSWLGALCALALFSAAGCVQAQTTNGLRGDYYVIDPLGRSQPNRGQLFGCKTPVFSRVDPNVDFNWGEGAPTGAPEGFPVNGFATRWTGILRVSDADAGEKVFLANSDDGMRIWIKEGPILGSDAPLVNEWRDQGGGDRGNGRITLKANTDYNVIVEFYENGGGAQAIMKWRLPSEANALALPVPTEVLFPAPALPTPQADNIRPGAPTNLTATTTAISHVTVSFAAPGDNGTEGTAGCYEVRRSLQPITEANFDAATAVGTDTFIPDPAGQTQTFTVTGLQPLGKYYVAIRARDEAGNIGPISNVLTVETPSQMAPLPTFSQVVDKAVYYDPNRATGWLTAAGAKATRDFFVGKGYQELNATQLAEFMQAHATSKVPSSVVMANDIFPDTVVDLAQGMNNIVNDYINNNGRVILYADWPLYYIANEGVANRTTPGAQGGQTVFGFPTGTFADGRPATITLAGHAIGLSNTWTSARSVPADSVDVVLATTVQGTAAGWIKFFGTTQGSGGLYRIFDYNAGSISQSRMGDLQDLAEVSGNPVAPGRLTGTVTDAQGRPVLSSSLTFATDGSSIITGTDNTGTYSFLGKPGTYTVTGTGATASGVRGTITGGNVTILSSQITNVPALTITPIELPATLPAPTDKVVYHDTYHTTGWNNRAEAAQISDYFVAQGYREVTAEELAEFMQAHLTGTNKGVVVFANDIAPETVVPLNEAGNAILPNPLLKRYLDAGNRIVFSADIPFYNISRATGVTASNYTPGGGGCTAVLGHPCSNGAWNTGDKPVMTDAGRAFGLTEVNWPRSLRATSPGTADLTLASSRGGAAAWAKFYPSNTGTGSFFYLNDQDPADGANAITDALLADMKKLAEFGGPLNIGSPVTGCKGDANNDKAINVGDAVVILKHSVAAPGSPDILTGNALAAAD
ncbi:MAG: hypothetical protein KY468_14185, partial [Armatimonadetes bacterium]|nr:hypothetical protein [Armatimonadota bacterium]